MSLFSFWKN